MSTNYLTKKIANLIIMNLHNTSEVGLFNGKMGSSLYLYRYAKYSGKDFYERFADDLIDEIYNDINKSMLPSLSEGLSGVGIGLKILLQEKYLNGNPDDVLAEVDNLLLEECFNSLKQDILLPHSVYSAGIYLLSRISNPLSSKERKWLENVTKNGYTFIEEAKPKEIHYQLSFLNSMLWVYSTLYIYIKNNEEYKSFIHYLFELTLDSVNNNRYDSIDLLVFKAISMNLVNIRQYNALYEKINALIMNIPYSMELWNDLLWWQFIYGFHLQNPPSNEEIIKYVDYKIQNYPFELSTINGQIASLGLYLINKSNFLFYN